MRALPVWVASGVALVATLAAFPVSGTAQYISLKTVPVATGDQFQLFPSQNMGMANVSIALDDPLLDPFVNPAKGSRLQGSLLFMSPSVYDVSGDNGSGRSLPAGLLAGSRSWFGAAALSLQQLEAAERPLFFSPFVRDGSAELLSEKSANNVYAFGMLGTRLPETSVSIGGSLFWAGLDAMEGVELLYAGSESIEQSGHMLDLRLGVYGELDGERTYEILLLHNRIDMTHDVTYVDFPPVVEPLDPPFVLREEENLDRTNTWGVHLGYVQPLASEGWRVGGIVTSNWKSHPKIPNYDIMNIPRDPGDSWALNFGLGVSRVLDETRLGLDLILEPIWSDTWADAAEPVPTAGGDTIPVGGRTVENEFSFTNALVRLGAGWEGQEVGFELGLQVRMIDYELRQVDHVQETKRRQDENWAEWTPTWGLSLKLSDVEVRYSGSVTTGTGRPGVAWTPGAFERLAAAADFADIIIAPSGPLTLQDENVFTHQVVLSIPVR